jgi:hypothetical protein
MNYRSAELTPYLLGATLIKQRALEADELPELGAESFSLNFTSVRDADHPDGAYVLFVGTLGNGKTASFKMNCHEAQSLEKMLGMEIHLAQKAAESKLWPRRMAPTAACGSPVKVGAINQSRSADANKLRCRSKEEQLYGNPEGFFDLDCR